MVFSKSLFASKTFQSLMAAVLGVWVAYFSGQMDMQAAISATVTAVLGIVMRMVSVGPVHIINPTVVTQASPDSKPVSQPAP